MDPEATSAGGREATIRMLRPGRVASAAAGNGVWQNGPGRRPAEAPNAEATAQGPSGNQAASLKCAAEVEPSELFVFKECQDLLRTRLREPMLGLIPQLTGLRLHLLWHRPLDFHEPGEMPVLCPMPRQLSKRAEITWSFGPRKNPVIPLAVEL